MTTECVFRSEHPDVLAWWAEVADVTKRFRENCRAIESRFPDNQLLVIESRRRKVAVALAGPKPGPAWRRDSRGDWAPYRNHRKDQSIIDLFNGTEVAMPTSPGMPADVWEMAESQTVYAPGIREAGGVIWAHWGCAAQHVEHDDRWQPAKLSEFYAAVGE